MAERLLNECQTPHPSMEKHTKLGVERFWSEQLKFRMPKQVSI